MSQTWNIPVPTTATLPSAREAVNDALEAVRTSHSGDFEPASPQPGQLWHDSTAMILKVRNATNTAWITIVSTDGP